MRYVLMFRSIAEATEEVEEERKKLLEGVEAISNTLKDVDNKKKHQKMKHISEKIKHGYFLLIL